MTHIEKYRHIGNSFPSVPKGWVPIVERTIELIESEMWVKWLPKFIKRYIHEKATGNSVYYIRSPFWNKIRNKLTKGMIVHDIKDKYATLSIYGYFNDRIETIIESAEEECSHTCEVCGSSKGKLVIVGGWYSVFCKNHLEEHVHTIVDKTVTKNKEGFTKEEVIDKMKVFNVYDLVAIENRLSEKTPLTLANGDQVWYSWVVSEWVLSLMK